MATAPAAQYQSALIQSLRGASPGFMPNNPGVTLLPNPTNAALPALNFRHSFPQNNLNVVPSAPAPAPFVAPPSLAPSLAPPSPSESELVQPSPPLVPPFVPVLPVQPEAPQAPDYTDDLYGPAPVPVPDYTDDLYGPEPVVPAEPAESTYEPAQAFPIPEQPEWEVSDLGPFEPIVLPEPHLDSPLVDDIPVPEILPLPIEPANIFYEPPSRDSVALPDEFINRLQQEERLLTDRDLQEMVLLDLMAQQLLTGSPMSPVVSFPSFAEER